MVLALLSAWATQSCKSPSDSFSCSAHDDCDLAPGGKCVAGSCVYLDGGVRVEDTHGGARSGSGGGSARDGTREALNGGGERRPGSGSPRDAALGGEGGGRDEPAEPARDGDVSTGGKPADPLDGGDGSAGGGSETDGPAAGGAGSGGTFPASGGTGSGGKGAGGTATGGVSVSGGAGGNGTGGGAPCTTDLDKDGFVSQACGGDDCDDTDANAKPRQTAYFFEPRKSGGYDYDCDGVDSKDPRLAKTVTCVSIASICDTNIEGFITTNPGTTPDCGVAAPWGTCTLVSLGLTCMGKPRLTTTMTCR